MCVSSRHRSPSRRVKRNKRKFYRGLHRSHGWKTRGAGVLVGRVSNIAYDDKTYSAIVTLSIQQNFNQFPADSRASIYTAGLLGEQYIELLPGAEDDYLKDGDRLLMADSAMILEQMIGRIIADKISE